MHTKVCVSVRNGRNTSSHARPDVGPPPHLELSKDANAPIIDYDDDPNKNDGTAKGMVIPGYTLQSVGVIDMDSTGVQIEKTELLERLTSTNPTANEPRTFGIKPGSYGIQWDPTTILRSYPTLFPYGVGLPSGDAILKSYFRYAMKFEDGRFASHKFFPFDIFGVQQKRESWRNARLAFRRRDWHSIARSMATVTKADIEHAVQEETRNMPISNPAIEKFIRSAVISKSKVVGSNASRARFRSDIWGACVMFGPPSIFLTINPADHHDPIAIHLAGADIDLDRFIPELGKFPPFQMSIVTH